MLAQTKQLLKEKWNLDDRLLEKAQQAETNSEIQRKSVRDIGCFNQLKVLNAFQECRISESHFFGSTGYGFSDMGREGLDEVMAKIFHTEAALVRLQFVSGTHALASVLFGNLRPKDRWISIIGTPYDTMLPVIHGHGGHAGSLKEWGIAYEEIPLNQNHKFDENAILKALETETKLVYIQRSLGYTWRPSIHIDDMQDIIGKIKSLSPQTIVMVDNCYGEFAEYKEPTEVGADVMGGSLIKNAGGGIAPAGGYVAGKREIVEKAAIYLTSPGIGPDEGATLGMNRLFYQGLFMAPSIVSGALEGAIWASYLLSLLNFEVMPQPDGKRTDIIQGIKFGNAKSLNVFCAGIQKSSPIDSMAMPEPVNMPGYKDPIIMAGGTFVQGSSIELSCDGPLREPYSAYLQGGLSFHHIQLGVLKALNEMIVHNLLQI